MKNSTYFFMVPLCFLSVLYAMDNEPHTQEELEALESAFITAVSEENLKGIEQLPIPVTVINKALLSITTLSGRVAKVTPLVYAAYNQSKNLLEALLKKGATPVAVAEIQEEVGTALQEAVKANNREMVDQIKCAFMADLNKVSQEIEAQLTALLIDNVKKLESSGRGESERIAKGVDLEAVLPLKVAIILNDLNKIKSIYEEKFRDINNVLVPLTLEPGKIVQVSPLCYAVRTQNIPLIKVLFETCHAIPLGKFDRVKEVSTPLVEAYKSGNAELIALIKEHALIIYKRNLDFQKLIAEQFLSSTQEYDQMVKRNKQLSMPVPQLQDFKRQLSISSDMLQLLPYLSGAEIDKVLMLQDRLLTYEYGKQLSHSYDTMLDKAFELGEKRFKALDSDRN